MGRPTLVGTTTSTARITAIPPLVLREPTKSESYISPERQYNTNVGTLEKGGQVAANPWKSAGYLSNVNRLQAGALDSEENAGKDSLQRENLRTGGLNTGATIGAQKDLSLKKMRLGDVLSAERSAGDFGKNVQYQTGMAEAPLRAAAAESPYYGSSTSLVDSR